MTMPPIDRAYRSIDQLVGRQGQEFDERIVPHELGEEARCLVVTTLGKVSAEKLADLPELFGDHRCDEWLRHLAPIIEAALGRANPLPHLRSRDFRGGGIFHQVEDRYRTLAGEPRADVLDRDIDVEPQSLFGDRRLGLETEQVR